MISTISVGSSSVIDYLTCGSCLKEFPLQKITAFIQHKKLDCDDETDVPEEDPGNMDVQDLRQFRSLRKHAYSNILKILPPKNDTF